MGGFVRVLALVDSSVYMCMSAFPSEPTCSKFDYEMKSLEAMLRTEHKVEKMLEEMRVLKEDISKDLDKSKAFRETTKTEIGESKSELKKWLIEKEGKIEEKLKSVSIKMDEKLQRIDTAFLHLSNKTEDFFNNSAIAFYVTNPTTALVNGVPTFSNIVTNIGGGYDTDTGVFTSPVDGLYLFLFTVASVGKYNIYCFIKRNGIDKAAGQTNSDNSYTTASASAILLLSKGDRVNLGQCHEWKRVYANYHTTTFSGTLLKQIPAN